MNGIEAFLANPFWCNNTLMYPQYFLKKGNKMNILEPILKENPPSELARTLQIMTFFSRLRDPQPPKFLFMVPPEDKISKISVAESRKTG